jgi:hypothetical protein
MALSLEIFYQDNYEIHKKFHCYIPHLASYLIKTIGIDCDSKINRNKNSAHKDSVYRKPNEKFLLLIRELPKRKRRRKNKINKHEFTNPV